MGLSNHLSSLLILESTGALVIIDIHKNCVFIQMQEIVCSHLRYLGQKHSFSIGVLPVKVIQITNGESAANSQKRVTRDL